MKKMSIFALLMFAILTLSTPVYAFPAINNVSFDPSQNIWIDESITLKVNCTDDVNQSVNVYAQIVGEDGYKINRNLTNQNGLFTTTLGSFLFNNKPNSFSVSISCVNNATDYFNDYFTVSNFTSDINAINPGTIYLGDPNPIVIDLFVKRNNVQITDNVNFNIILNGTAKLPIDKTYIPSRGWILYLDRPNASGTYSLQITSSYDRINKTQSTTLTVKDPIQFSVINTDNIIWVRPNDTINLQVQALDRGSPIPINTNNLAVQVGSTQATITSITPSSNYFNVVVQIPVLSPGMYALTASLSYQNYTYPNSSTIYYIAPVSGKITDHDGKGIAVQLRFLSSNVEKLKLYTDSNGAYSGSLPPGTYDIETTFPQSTLYLKSASINSFNDPIKYFYSTEYLVPGIRNAGLFSYEIGLTFYEAGIEMKYDERNVFNENDLVVFKCSNWNSGRKVCNDKWFEIGGSIDTIRNVVTLNLSSLSAFVIGERKKINVNYNLDNENYYISSPIKINGIVKDSDGDAVSNATVYAFVKNTGTRENTISDSNGAFSIEFKAPEIEGSYTLALSAEKNPYIIFNDSKSFEVLKSRTVEIAIPDTIKLKQGQNFTQEISIINTGQANLLNLSISLIGIPTNYFNITKLIERLRANEENKIYVSFSIPEDAEQKTYSVTIEVSNDEIKQEKIFGFTIVGKNETVNEVQTSPTGRFILPSMDSNVIYITIFAVVSFSVAVILKKMKVRRSKRNEITNFLFDVKDYFRKKRNDVITDFKNISDYRNLIKSEFPNALKNKDKYGKDN
jgi:hypothetical protein